MNCKYCNEPIEAEANYCAECQERNKNAEAGVLPKMQQKKVVQCANKLHYYDAAIYSSCPHCASMGQNPQETVHGSNPVYSAGTAFAAVNESKNKKKDKREKKEKKSLFSFGKKVFQQTPVSPAYENTPVVNQNKSSKTVALLDFESEEQEPVQVSVPEMPRSAKKAVFRSNTPVNEPKQNEKVEMPVNEAKLVMQNNEEPMVNVSVLEKNEYSMPKKIQTPSMHEGKNRSDSSPKTIAIYNDLSNDEPVVGWLVCVKGLFFGQSFNLVAGKNLIGRSPEMDIDLTGEDSVSRNVHAVIIYEPKKRQFILKAGDNKGLTYINDELVIEHETLKSYDKIQLGECELVFVEFCNEKFTWDSYTDKA